MRKWIVQLVLVAIVLSTWPSSAVGASFPDVEEQHPHYGAIEFLKSESIINGYPDGTFQPERTINRAEALKIALLTKEYLGDKLDTSSGDDVEFPDVNLTDWFYNYVQLAASAGVVKGYPDGTFKPDKTINAAESLKIALLTLEDSFEESTVSTKPYADVASDVWFAPYVDYAKGLQYIEAAQDYKYYPERDMTRGEFAELVFRIAYTKENEFDKFPISLNWNFCNNYQLGYKIKYPHSWTKLMAEDHLIVWAQDEANGQVSFARAYPNSAIVIVSLDDNPDGFDLEKYIDLIDYGSTADKQFLTLNGLSYASVFIEDTGLQDNYFQLSNGDILIVYSQIGNGPMADQLKEEIRYMLGSLRESSGPSDNAFENCMEANPKQNASSEVSEPDTDKEKLSQAYEKVMVENVGKTTIESLGSAIIIDTDSIGIGTGPIDYYYVEAFDVTLKLERDSDTILAIEDGETTAF